MDDRVVKYEVVEMRCKKKKYRRDFTRSTVIKIQQYCGRMGVRHKTHKKAWKMRAVMLLYRLCYAVLWKPWRSGVVCACSKMALGLTKPRSEGIGPLQRPLQTRPWKPNDAKHTTQTSFFVMFLDVSHCPPGSCGLSPLSCS